VSDAAFTFGNVWVMPFWIAMVFAPTTAFTRRLVSSPWIVAGPAAAYAVLMVPALATLLPVLVRPELATLAPLLGTPDGTALAWLHFLAFDLFIGRWILLDALDRGTSPWLVSPVLVLALLVAPLGLLTWLSVRGRGPLDPARRSG